ncbi:hypothetical protein pdam_00022194 [Pocillopora damicornis]|uniref:Uncharacterized protein n=1 Tax=Pocillopora damicornis TaxID=46731 RepID=A0A3M6UPY9_POCDA|nr:hypothetical protein pdam_00022194 [Pocillopora damicornis]
MNKDEEVDADDLVSETERTRHQVNRFGWALWMGPLENTKSRCVFLRKQRSISSTCTGQGRKLYGFPNMEFKRRHRPEMLYRTDWLIEQQLAGYFSRISALTKAGLLKRFSSVSMNKDEEVDAHDLVSETYRTR